MKFTIKKFIAIFAIILFIVNAINIKSFANIEKRDLYSKGTCGRLLKKGDMVVKTSIVVYKKDGKEYAEKFNQLEIKIKEGYEKI